MSNTKAFIDYTLQDNGHSAREALYAEIHDRVMSHIEAKKMELANGMLTREETEEKEEHEDEKEDKAMVKKMVKKDCLTKEGVEGDEDEDDDWDEDGYEE